MRVWVFSLPGFHNRRGSCLPSDPGGGNCQLLDCLRPSSLPSPCTLSTFPCQGGVLGL